MCLLQLASFGRTWGWKEHKPFGDFKGHSEHGVNPSAKAEAGFMRTPQRLGLNFTVAFPEFTEGSEEAGCSHVSSLVSGGWFLNCSEPTSSRCVTKAPYLWWEAQGGDKRLVSAT